MALHDFTNLKATVVRHAMEGLTTHTNDRWRLFTNVHTDNVSQLSIRSMSGISEPTAWDFDGEQSTSFDNLPVARLDQHNKLDLAYSVYGLSVHISRYDAMDLGGTGPGGVVGMASQKLGAAVAHHFNNLAYSNIAGSFTGTGLKGGVALVDTSHPLAAGGTQSNKLTTVLDRSALYNAIAVGKRLKSYNGMFTPYFDSNLTLVVAPELEATAHEILASQYNRANDMRDLNSTTEIDPVGGAGGRGSEFGMQANAVKYINGNSQVTLCVSSHLTDANDWFLVSAQEKPYHMHIRSMPLFTVDLEPTDRSYRVSTDYAIATGHGPDAAGVVGSSVA